MQVDMLGWLLGLTQFVHVVAKFLLCGCGSVQCAPRPAASQHAGALQTCSARHLLVALQAVRWCYWLVLGFRV